MICLIQIHIKQYQKIYNFNTLYQLEDTLICEIVRKVKDKYLHLSNSIRFLSSTYGNGKVSPLAESLVRFIIWHGGIHGRTFIPLRKWEFIVSLLPYIDAITKKLGGNLHQYNESTTHKLFDKDKHKETVNLIYNELVKLENSE